MGQIFISYRREDSAGHAGRLEQALEARFGVGGVFRDVSDLRPGEPFPRALVRGLEEASAMLVLIGPKWLVSGEEGRRRLDETDDYVRLEVAHGLSRGIAVVPLLIDQTQMPTRDTLPKPIQSLAERQALRLSDPGWDGDVDRLCEALERLSGLRRQPTLRRRAVIAAALLLPLGAGLWWWRGRGPAFPTGRWQATVHYPWGIQQRELFELVLDGDRVVGRVSFLGVAREIVSGRWQGGRLRIETHSQEHAGGAPRRIVHQYEILPRGEQLLVRYRSRGADGARDPLEFIARRSGQAQ